MNFYVKIYNFYTHTCQRVYNINLLSYMNNSDLCSLTRFDDVLGCNLIISSYFNSIWVKLPNPWKGALFSMIFAYKVEWKKYFERRGGTKGMVLAILLLTLFSTSVHLTWSPSGHVRVNRLKYRYIRTLWIYFLRVWTPKKYRICFLN